MTPNSRFDGPLDLLLEEVRRQNVEIEQIAMAPIVARYLEYMRAAAERNMNLDIEWLYMAATLIQWKSQALLPKVRQETEAPDPIRDEIVQQLLAYKKDAAEELGRRRTVHETRYSRTSPQGAAASPELPEIPHSVADLIDTARDVAVWIEQRRSHGRYWREIAGAPADDVSIAEMTAYLLQQLDERGVLDGERLLDEQTASRRRCTLFLAMLELARDGTLEAQQNETFGAITLRRRG